MDPTLRRVFDTFPGVSVAIIGSAARDLRTARDIDLLFLSDQDFFDAVRRYGASYNGWNRGRVHIRRATIHLPHVSLPVQLTHSSAVRSFVDHPYMLLLRDGSLLHPDSHFAKSAAPRRPFRRIWSRIERRSDRRELSRSARQREND